MLVGSQSWAASKLLGNGKANRRYQKTGTSIGVTSPAATSADREGGSPTYTSLLGRRQSRERSGSSSIRVAKMAATIPTTVAMTVSVHAHQNDPAM